MGGIGPAVVSNHPPPPPPLPRQSELIQIIFWRPVFLDELVGCQEPELRRDNVAASSLLSEMLIVFRRRGSDMVSARQVKLNE